MPRSRVLPGLLAPLLLALLALAPLAQGDVTIPGDTQAGEPFDLQEAESAQLSDAGDADAATGGWMETVDSAMGKVNKEMADIFFAPVPIPWTVAEKATPDEPDKNSSAPLAVLVLVLGAVYFTIRMGLPQFKSFRHSIDVVRGKYDNPDDKGEVTSFQALTAALSATVGLGNIGGVAIAVGTGGPGATFWMIMAGFFGMASKFTECTLGQMYREVRPDGRVMGGAMYYLSSGLKELGLGAVGKVLAVFFAVVCVGASFGGGNTFQVSQSLGAVSQKLTFLDPDTGMPWIYGAVMAVLVAIVILGGIKRIASVAERIVPTMCMIYVLCCLAILAMRFTEIPGAFGQIWSGAFTPRAGFGGLLGVLVMGFKRGAFSNEAGVGSAAIAHSAAKTPYAVREGIVALLEPFIDTIVVCTMTALVIVITGAWDNPEYSSLVTGDNGAALTSNAMGEVLPFAPWVLAVATVLFAFSTMISWSYYGERCWAYLFGDGTSAVYRWIFVAFVFLGSIVSAKNVLNFGDLLIFGMVFPNIVGLVLLSGKVKRAYVEYQAKLNAGEMETYD